MSTELRELFDTAAESKPPYDLGERAMAGARRRRQRYAVVGAVVASAAMVLGVVVVSGQLQTDASPRPIDVANLPDALPAADGLPNLQAGMVDAASVVYLDGSFMVVVDASSGEAFRTTFGPPPVDGAVFSIAISPTDVVLSPDGRRALVTVTGWQGALPTLRVLDLATTQETVVPDLTPWNPSTVSQIERPAVAAWSNDSSSVTCLCADSKGSLLGGYEVLLRDRDPLAAEVRMLWALQPELWPYQVAIGTAGLAVQRKPGGAWPLTFVSEGGPGIPPAEAVALGRGTAPTYFALGGDGFTIGEVGRDFSDPVTQTAEGSLKYERHLGDVVEIPTVEAVRDGFVVVVTTNSLARNLRSAPPVDPAQVLLVGTDGAQGLVTTLPSGVVVASFATDRLQVPPDTHTA